MIFSGLDSPQALPVPTIAVVDGFALGGGAELAVACDLRVSGAEATFSFPETQLGIIPGAGGTQVISLLSLLLQTSLLCVPYQRLPRLIGLSRAKELLFTCRRVNMAEALELGLADHGTSGSGDLAYAKALDLARSISRSAPLSLKMAKEAVEMVSVIGWLACCSCHRDFFWCMKGMNVDLHQGLKVEELCYAQLLQTKDRLEGLRAFSEKRTPVFKGE